MRCILKLYITWAGSFYLQNLLCKEDMRQLGVASNMSAKINNEGN